MYNIVVYKDTALCIVIDNICITQDDGQRYELTEQDGIDFYIRQVTNNKNVVIHKTLDNGALIQDDNIVVYLEPEDTKQLLPLGYEYECKLRLGYECNRYTLARGCLVVKDSVVDGGSTNANAG